MNIAVDARELSGTPTGVGTYLAHLLEEWARMPEARAHRWTLYLATARAGRAGSKAEALPCREGSDSLFDWCDLPGSGGTWWEQVTLASAIRATRPDVLFAPGYTAPLAVRTPVVLTVHDVSFFAHPEWFGAREGLRRRLVTRRAAGRARTVLTVSEFSKREIVARLGVHPDRVVVVRHGITRPAETPAVEARPPMVLFVGSIFNRRRVPDLIRAFASATADLPDARLEIVGDNRTHPHQDLAALAREQHVTDRVTLRSYVSDEQLRALYAKARVFAFLSEYEGFGLTPLEALAHWVPIVVLDTPVAREVYEDAAIYVQAGDVDAAAEALKRLLSDADARNTQIGRADRVLGRYCWPHAARRTLDIILQAGARG